MAERLYNFSAGPAMMPEVVNSEVAEATVNFNDTGMGIGEISHRSDEFLAVANEAETDLRELLDIPDNYKVLFLQGGATGQFRAIPQNLTTQAGSADYVVTGIWGKKAVAEGQKGLNGLTIVAQTQEHTFVPPQADWQCSEDAAYLHITPNETINGVAFANIPDVDVPLVADMSSVILSEALDIRKFGVIYAGAQKNIGPAGLTVVIVRDDLLGNARYHTPIVWDWTAQAEAHSMVNTPPTSAWYAAGRVFKWLKEQGGLASIAEVNQRKADKLYEAIDGSGLYANAVRLENRSRMNVPFTLAQVGLEKVFLAQARAEGLINLEGHRDVGGLRASIYNAMPEEGVDRLVAFMQDFEQAHI